MINKVYLFMLVSVLTTFNHTVAANASSFQNNHNIRKENLRSQFLLLTINFTERSPHLSSISFSKPYTYYEEDFKKLIEISNQALGRDHQISVKLQQLYKRIDDYWYTNSNYYANNLDARYAEEDAIKYLYGEVFDLIQQL